MFILRVPGWPVANIYTRLALVVLANLVIVAVVVVTALRAVLAAVATRFAARRIACSITAHEAAISRTCVAVLSAVNVARAITADATLRASGRVFAAVSASTRWCAGLAAAADAAFLPVAESSIVAFGTR